MPLSVVHVGPCLLRGGAEQHLIDLARFPDPERARLTECLVIDGNAIDLAVARDLPCPARAATGEDITRALQTADIRHLHVMANTLRLHRSGLLNWYDHPLSTGPLEGINNKTGALRRRAYGIRNFEHLTERLLTLHHAKYTLQG